ncbi:MAG: YggS family pyridoxal phosphate-dependent enzyme [Thermoanaerobaculia bacterium]
MSSVRERVEAIERRIAGAAERSGRPRQEIALIAVSKTFGPEAVEAAIEAGIRDLGENRVQEARDKIPGVKSPVRWHMIGHLQSNKAKEAVGLFDVIQTIHSVSLADRVARVAGEISKRVDVLLQVNVGAEEQKSGVDPAGLPALAAHVSGLPELRMIGLMTIPPLGSPDQVRPLFAQIRELRDRLRERHEECRELSMGMSDDFEVAIEEGATMVRIGRAIFGGRG